MSNFTTCSVHNRYLDTLDRSLMTVEYDSRFPTVLITIPSADLAEWPDTVYFLQDSEAEDWAHDYKLLVDKFPHTNFDRLELLNSYGYLDLSD